MKLFLISIFTLLFISGCTSDKDVVYSKPINHWVSKINNNIDESNLDLAYDNFLSLSAEHREYKKNSNLLLKIILSYIEDNNVEKSNKLLDVYLSRYGNDSNVDYIHFIKIKANHNSIDLTYRNQVKIIRTIDMCDSFLNTFKDSKYTKDVIDLKNSLTIKKNQINCHILEYYEKKDQDIGCSLYKKKIDPNFLDNQPKNFFRNLFE